VAGRAKLPTPPLGLLFFGLIREIYDHDKDPHENVNTAAEPEYKQDVERLSQMLKQGWHAALPG